MRWWVASGVPVGNGGSLQRLGQPGHLRVQETLGLLSGWLQAQDYRFTTVTPATHARVLARSSEPAQDLRGVFGWSKPFAPALLPEQPLLWLQQGGLLRQQGEYLRSEVRFSSLEGRLFAHSAYPTQRADAVFFGPDTYRFAALLVAELDRQPLAPGARILDVGCGSGAGGIVAALHKSAPGSELVLSDINPAALPYAAANAIAAGLPDALCLEGDLFDRAEGSFDLIVANPPYLVDAGARAYRHGGGSLGSALSERIVTEGVERLAPGGRLLLYSGVAIVDGRDLFKEAISAVCPKAWPMRYRELDVDVFGEELDEPAYATVERIAAVALIIQRPGH